MTQDRSVSREEAIPRLVESHGGQLFRLGSSICATREEAEDLVQEIFLQAWRDWHQFEGRSSPKTWLYTIAYRTCQRMHRRHVGEPAKLASLDEELPFGRSRVAVLASDYDVLDEQSRREQREVVGAAISGLPDDFRMPLVLKDIVGFSVEEVAAILGVNPATVKTRLHRARIKVRNALVQVDSGDGRSGSRIAQERELPPPAYSQQVCLDLLQAKQESLDRGVAMPGADELICERCQAVFHSLDFAKDVCVALGREAMPGKLRDEILRRIADNR